VRCVWRLKKKGHSLPSVPAPDGQRNLAEGRRHGGARKGSAPRWECGLEANSVPPFQVLIRPGRSNRTESSELGIEGSAYLDSNTPASNPPQDGDTIIAQCVAPAWAGLGPNSVDGTDDRGRERARHAVEGCQRRQEDACSQASPSWPRTAFKPNVIACKNKEQSDLIPWSNALGLGCDRIRHLARSVSRTAPLVRSGRERSVPLARFCPSRRSRVWPIPVMSP